MTRTNAFTDVVARDGAIFLIASTIVALDQITKSFVRAYLALGQSVPEDWPVRISHYSNTGAAFSLFPNQTMLFVVIAIAAIAIIVFYSRQLPRDGMIVRVGLGLQLGGAIGNLIDRLFYGRVTDFIDVGFWPVFNFADSSIVIGVGLLAYFILFTPPKQPIPTRVEGTDQPQDH